MKDNFLQKHADFFILLAAFAIPPVFNSGQNIGQISGQASYSAAAPIPILLLYGAVCSYVLFKMKFGLKDFRAFSVKSFFAKILVMTISLVCLLILNAMLWNFMAGYFSSEQLEIEKVMPDGAFSRIHVVISLFIAALYEELLYRKFLPEEALSMLPKSAQCRVPSTMIRFFAELSIILIFALGHRYLGMWAVINAFCAGMILRFFCVRTGSFLSGFVAHFVYNLIVFFIL